MKVAILTLTPAEVKEQLATIEKYTALLDKEISFGHLMNVQNVSEYAATIKNAHAAIKDGFRFDNPFMVEMLASNPNARIVEVQ